ncbi:lysylphosphatidylglycerol synthase transmembrane domain-containing protein [Herbaspirillum huttiense]|uniref:lysylphosphatidylglycerol synthase transmembrane domain-containing protein n=1 Tax=Herbaspirillum huttiense TaxID=863372 RepID=UPI0031D5EE6A
MNISLRAKPVLLTLAKMAVTGLIFYGITRKINISQAMAAPVENKAFLVLAFVIALLIVFVQAGRWHLLLNYLGIRSDTVKDIKAVWAGHLLNNVLPTSAIGDVLRSYALRERGAGRTQWVSALLIEKFFAMATALAVAGLMVIGGQLGDTPVEIKLIVLAFLLLGIAAPFILRVLAILGARVLPANLVQFLRSLATSLVGAVSTRAGLMALGVSFLINILICLIFFCIAAAMGLQISAVHCMFIVPVFTILAGLPISYGGWGVRELTGIHLLQYYGVPSQIALSTTFLFGLTIFLSSLPGLLALPTFRNVLKRKE